MARRGSPVVKELEVDLVPYFSLFVDLDRAHRAGTGVKSTLEYVVRSAASLVWSAVRRGDTVQLFGEGAASLFVPPGAGELHLTHCLFELIRVRQEGRTPLLDLLERHRLQVPSGSTVALLAATVSLDEERLEEALESLGARGVRAVVLAVNGDSFLPIHRAALPRDEAAARCRGLESRLRSRGVAGAILSADQELDAELSRPDLFETAP
jgi:uncharacterized protein (DUF58 family)